MIKFKISHLWDDVRTLSEIEKVTKFAYFFTKKDGTLAPNDQGYPRLVHCENEYLHYTAIDSVSGGLRVCATGQAGKPFIKELSKSYDMLLFTNPREAIKQYLDLVGDCEFYEILDEQAVKTVKFMGINPEDYRGDKSPPQAFVSHSENG